MTRMDAFIGDNRHFQNILYDLDLLQLGQFGDNGPFGHITVFNLPTLIGMKKLNIMITNPKFQFGAQRMSAAYAEASFIVNVFANGTTKQATLPIIGFFFRNQTFPVTWYRAAAPVTGAVVGATAAQIGAAIDLPPRVETTRKACMSPTLRRLRRSTAALYVTLAMIHSTPLEITPMQACFAYFDQAANTPSVLVNTTGLFKKNVDFLMGILFRFASTNSGCDQQVLPFGPAGV